MANVYIIGTNGTTHQMPRIHCRSEDKELQSLLEKNPDLIPGDQINPDDPRRWLLVKREMPVPDPNTGTDRWSVDFFLVDQDAIPTFVECKRFKDTRSRREVIGQVFEYAANAHYYWTKDIIQAYAEESSKCKGLSLDESLLSLQPTDEETAESFFEKVKENLREGQIRIVFFMEDSPFELRSVVDFLNKQMERSEVLLVEARLFEKDGYKVVAPSLFGYTEEARRVKRTVSVKTSTSRKKWDEPSFLDDANNKLDQSSNEAVIKLYEFCKSAKCEIKWGTGFVNGSFSFVCPSICPRSLFTVWSNGSMQLNFGWLRGSETSETYRDRFKELVKKRLEFQIPENYVSKYLGYPVDVWGPRVHTFIKILEELLTDV